MHLHRIVNMPSVIATGKGGGGVTESSSYPSSSSALHLNVEAKSSLFKFLHYNRIWKNFSPSYECGWSRDMDADTEEWSSNKDIGVEGGGHCDVSPNTICYFNKWNLI